MSIHSSFRFLVCEGLKYCCEWAFFTAHRQIQTGLIATRLGCDRRTVNYHRKAFNEKQLKCDECKGCLKDAIYELNKRLGPTHKARAMFIKPKGVS